MAANDRQPGGDHYKRFGNLQPWDVITHFKLGFMDGNAVKYLLRWDKKNEHPLKQIEDLEKAKHYIDKLIEQESLKYTEACKGGAVLGTREEAYERTPK